MQKQATYWKKFLGIEVYKLNYYSKWFIYSLFRIKLPKLREQRAYWTDRGQVYMDEIRTSGYLEREIFFQNMLIERLKQLDFSSFFEAGCGFGWNIKRVKQEFPLVTVGGVDFSYTQLLNSKKYLEKQHIPVISGDNCCMPLKNNAFDVGFSLGVFMNIHHSKIRTALREMIRVCKKYIIHIEYDEHHTTPELRRKRAFKTNIISHDYKNIYKELGLKILEFATYRDFGDHYFEHEKNISNTLERWEGFEGPEKYIVIVLKKV